VGGAVPALLAPARRLRARGEHDRGARHDAHGPRLVPGAHRRAAVQGGQADREVGEAEVAGGAQLHGARVCLHHAVRCVHLLVTLFEKLDAMARRNERNPVEADTFVRHYKDAARIIQSFDRLPAIEMTIAGLARDMVAKNDMRAIPKPDEPALRLDYPDKRQAIERAYARIAPMFWGPRILLDEACSAIREWLRQLERIREDKG